MGGTPDDGDPDGQTGGRARGQEGGQADGWAQRRRHAIEVHAAVLRARADTEAAEATRLVAEFARHGVALRTRGFRPQLRGLLRWLVTRRGTVPMVGTWTKSVLYQGYGTKELP